MFFLNREMDPDILNELNFSSARQFAPVSTEDAHDHPKNPFPTCFLHSSVINCIILGDNEKKRATLNSGRCKLAKRRGQMTELRQVENEQVFYINHLF